MADQCFLMISTLMMLTLVLSVIECGYGGYGHEYQHHDAHGHHGGHGSGYVQPHYHYYQVKNKKSGLVLGLGGLLTGLAAGLALGLIPVPMTMAMTATGKRSVQDTAQNPWEDVVHILKSQLTAKDESGICKIALKACTVDIAKIQQMFVESFRTSSR